jgi:cell division protein FtsL
MREIYYVKPIDNSRLVPVMDPRAPRQYLGILFLTAAVLAVILFSSWQRFRGIEDGYRLEALQKQKQDITESNRKLRLEEASLVNPVRIDTIARNDLGMTPLAPPQIIRETAPQASETPVVADSSHSGGSLAYLLKNVAAAVP